MRALNTLDDRDRELLSLRYGADFSARHIAELFEQRTNTVEVALHRALARLRNALERHDTATVAESRVLKPEVSP
jgi:RNA polymerase sigma-70 factor (ECF subfamily)